MKLFLNLLLAVLLLNCSGSKNDQETTENMTVDYLIFKFHDSSVPPPYHRSYRMEFRDSTVHIVVDSYGEILSDTILNIGKDNVAKSFALVEQFGIVSKEKNTEEAGCTGGTGISIDYGYEGKFLCSGYVYFCAGEQFGDLSGDLQGLKYALNGLVSDFNQYLKEG